MWFYLSPSSPNSPTNASCKSIALHDFTTQLKSVFPEACNGTWIDMQGCYSCNISHPEVRKLCAVQVQTPHTSHPSAVTPHIFCAFYLFFLYRVAQAGCASALLLGCGIFRGLLRLLMFRRVFRPMVWHDSSFSYLCRRSRNDHSRPFNLTPMIRKTAGKKKIFLTSLCIMLMAVQSCSHSGLLYAGFCNCDTVLGSSSISSSNRTSMTVLMSPGSRRVILVMSIVQYLCTLSMNDHRSFLRTPAGSGGGVSGLSWK